jgi:prevent-host-death family protein
MFDIKKDIQAMTTFRRNPGQFMKHLKKTKRPWVLTVNGKAEAVVQDAEAYQKLLDIAAQADEAEGIRQGLEDVKKGRVYPGVQSSKRSAASMRYHVKLAGRTIRDLEILYDFIGADSSEQAFVWFNSLVDAIYTLEKFPNRGSINSKNKKLRQLLFGNNPHIYKIIYSINKPNCTVTVLHIRHGARSLDSM